MQEALYGVRLVHHTDPSAKASVCQAVTKAADRVGHNKHGVGRVECQDDVRDDVAERCHDHDTSLAKPLVNTSLGEGGDGISGERGQEDERHNGVTKIIVGSELLIGKTGRDQCASGTKGHHVRMESKPTRSSVSKKGCLLTFKITHSNCGVIHSSNGER